MLKMEILISENLKKCRKIKGNTQEELSEFLGVSIQAVSKWERNESFPDITLLPKIAMYYNISVDDLLGVGKIQVEKKIDEYHTKSDLMQRNAEFDNNLVIWSLCRLYISLGNEEKALEYARQAPMMDITQNHLFSLIYKGEKAVEQIQHSLLTLVYLAYDQIIAMINQANFTTHEKRKVYTCCLNLINWLYEDGDYGFFATRVSVIYANLAFLDAVDENLDETMKNLSLSADYAVIFLTQKGFKHTSFLANRLTHNEGQGYPNSVDNDCKILLNALKMNEFDFCRESGDFKEIKKRLEKYTN